MSMDRSFKGANLLVRHRNVLTRTEKLQQLAEEEKWNEKISVFGLPKVAHRKQELAKGPAKEEAVEGVALTGTASPAAGAAKGAAGAGAAKGAAAPAAGAAKGAPAKAAAPAAKKK